MDFKKKLKQATQVFRELEGRQPRVMVTGKGSGVPGLGAAKLAGRLADVGFDVDFGPLCREPEVLCRLAAENDSDVICLVRAVELDASFVHQICAITQGKEHAQQVSIYMPKGEGPAAKTFEMGNCIAFLDGKNLFADLLGVIERMPR